MFRNKLDVDRHVAKTLAKVKTEKDRNFRAYSIARLYFDIGDYETCVKYIGMYLSVKDDNPAAHTLLGQSYHKLGMVERALAEYKASLALDPNQNNLILKVCELLSSSDIPMDAGSARYWAERAAAAFPDHPALFALKANILAAQGAGAPATLALLKAETNARPNDPVPHARLLRHLVQASNTQESFKYAFDTNFSTDRFNSSPLWNEAVTEVLSQTGANQFGWQYWILKLTVLERLAEISLTEGRGPSDATNAVWKLDRALYEASQCILTVSPTKVLGAEALSHFGGQLCLHAATLLLKKAGQEAGGWREAVRAATPLFLLALQPIMPLKSPPTPAPSLPPASSERLLYAWYKEGAYRRSQAGHTLRNCFKEKRNVFIEKVSQYCSGTHWRDKLYRKLFTTREHLERINTSYLLNASELSEVNLRIPKSDDLKLPDKVAGSLKPSSLHNQIWLGMNSDNLADVSSFGMEELRLSVNNLSNCGAETLNRLDVDTFLYCAVLTAKQNAENERKSGYWDPDRPNILPSILLPQLCTPAQNKWWTAMWKTGGSGKGDISDVRLTLTRGIETVRCVGSHGIDPELLIDVARIFAKRSEHAADSTTQKFLEARANILYSAGVPLLERIRNNISIRPPEKRLFEYNHGELAADKLEILIEEGKLYLAVQCMNNKDDDKAIEILETIKSPYASFHLYKIFKKLSDDITPDRERADPDKKGKRTLYLTKAREFLYLTMDRLKAMHADSEHPLYGELGDNIENIEQALIKAEPLDRSRHGDGLAYSSDEDSLPGSSLIASRNTSLALTSYTPRSVRRRRNEVQPSPESLEAQIRQLQKKNSVMSAFVEQAKVLVESNKMLVDEVRDMKKALGDIKNYNIEDTIQDQFRNLKLSVEEVVTTKINEYKDESAADVQDLKREIDDLKKELGKLKNANTERQQQQQQQLDENELLMLEEEAGAYFRQAPAPVLPPQHYPIYPPGALYSLYGQYPSVPQLFPGALFQDQPLYSDLLGSRTVPQTVPPVVPPIVAGTPALPPVTAAQPVMPSAVPNAAPILQTPGLILPEQPQQPAIHNYHIPLPQKVPTFQNLTPSKPPGGLQSDVSTPLNKPLLGLQGDATSTPKPFGLFDTSANAADQKPFSFLNSPGTFDASQNKSGVDKSRTLSERSTESYDPIPDFKPIIELPDEVPTTTGEEDEEELFVSRAKLFRFIEKEWKERGLGNIKLLKNKTTGKVRVLMRRERVHTICANHIITPDIEISPMKDKDKAYFWGANDFADNELQYEKFCIRFKTAEMGNEFYNKFCKALEESKLNSSLNNSGTVSETTQSIGGKKQDEKKGAEKPSVGGLTFFNTPVIKTNETPALVSAANKEPPKVNPFASFSFNKTTSTTSTVNVFSLSKSNETTKPLFNTTKAAGDVKAADENIIYETPVKVATVSANASSFHDKGQGVVKVIKDKEARLVIVQEKGGEVWYDHPITKTNKFEPVLQLNTLSWKNPENVTFRVTFTTPAIYKKFQEIVADCVATAPDLPAGNAANMIPATVSGWGDKFKPKAGSWDCPSCYINNKGSDANCVACNSPKDPPKKEDKPSTHTFGAPATVEKKETVKPAATLPANAPVSGWGDLFKPQAGSWDCKSCYINNKASENYCVACSSPKDPSMPKKEDSSSFAAAAPMKFTFGMPPTNGGTPSMPQTTSTIPISNTIGAAPSAFGSSGFTFGMPQGDKPLISTPNKGLTFGDLAPANNASPFPQKNTFQFTLKPKSPAKDKDASLNKSQESDNEYASEDEGDHIVFAPIVPLPNKVDVKTGEEDEEVLYVHKAKLFRFSEGEWKECGVGDIKILKHPQTKKLRVLMRREPINKICLNHILNDDIKYLVKDERSWLFYANDFSMEELTLTQFCIRFKNKTIAQEFLDAVNKARADLPQSSGDVTPKSATGVKEQKSDDEVVFVSETEATAEDKEKAKKLMLPENFYNYKHMEPCKGCVGCDPDKYVFPTPKSSKNIQQVTKEDKVKADTKKTQEEPKTFVFGQHPSLFASPTTTSVGFTPVVGTPFSINTSESIFSGRGDSGSIFSGTKSGEADKKGVIAAPKLSVSAAPTPQQPAVAGQGLFSTNSFSAKPAESVFGAKPDLTNTQSSFAFKPSTISNTGAVFGTNQNSLFKAPVSTPGTASTTQATLLFSQAAKAQESVPAFGTPGTVFGSSKPFGSTDPKTVFGSANINTSFGQTDNKPLFGTPSFGSNDNKYIFGGSTEQKPLDGSIVAKPLAANPENGEKEPSVASPAPVLGGAIAADLSFSALAAKTKDIPLGTEDKSKSFSWAGAGTPLFSSQKNKSLNTSANNKATSGQDNNDESHEGEENYDPHFEPIIPLPDEVKVVTGEEDEVVKYEHRAKLFRFTTEWKERGIGDLKLLYHPEKKTYRLLLRQSQVHKTVLNQRVTKETQMLPMAKSDRALMWAGINYTEDNPEGAPEKLAVRFSNPETTTAFLNKINAVLKELEERPSADDSIEERKEVVADIIPTTVQQNEFSVASRQDGGGDQRQQEGHKTEGEDEEEDEDDDEDPDNEDYHGDYYGYEHGDEYDGDYYDGQYEEDLAVVYESEAIVDNQPAHLILYAGQQGGHLRVYSGDDLLSDTFVVDGAEMKCDGDVCRWKGVDSEDEWKTAKLPDDEVATALHASFQDLL